MNNKLETKDFVSLALYSALFVALWFISMMISTPFGAMGHQISPGIQGIIGGPLIYFVAHRLGKMWQFSIMWLITMLVFTLMGGGYLPWFITTMTGAVIADLMVSRTGDTSVVKLGVANGIMAVGCAWGSVVPTWFFLESYRAEWIARVMTAADMDATIVSAQGIMGLLVTVVCFVMGFIGIYIGKAILDKYLNR